MVQLSIIIPVYKSETTLDRCVNSVLKQEVTDMEVILVDDGSPDACPQMCDLLAESDKRIKVIHKENGGLSDARNAGIDIAMGEYITFVDSDDYLLEDTYPDVLKLLKDNADADVVEYSVKQEDATRQLLDIHDCVYDSAKGYWLQTMAWTHSYSWNKIYRRELFDHIRFTKGRLFEDILILPYLLNASRKIITTTKGTYVYTVNEEGISKQVNRHTTLQLLLAEANAVRLMKTLPWNKNASNIYYYILCRCYDMIRMSLSPLMKKIKQK